MANAEGVIKILRDRIGQLEVDRAISLQDAQELRDRLLERDQEITGLRQRVDELEVLHAKQLDNSE